MSSSARGQTAGQFAGGREMAPINLAQQFRARHRHVVRIARAEEKRAFVRARAAADADVQDNVQRTALTAAVASNFASALARQSAGISDGKPSGLSNSAWRDADAPPAEAPGLRGGAFMSGAVYGPRPIALLARVVPCVEGRAEKCRPAKMNQLAEWNVYQ